MSNWIIGSLLLAWFLSWFGFDGLFIEATKEIFKLTISSATYYFVFFMFGCGFGIFEYFKLKQYVPTEEVEEQE